MTFCATEIAGGKKIQLIEFKMWDNILNITNISNMSLYMFIPKVEILVLASSGQSVIQSDFHPKMGPILIWCIVIS